MAQDLPAIKIAITPNFEGFKETSLAIRLGIQKPETTAKGTLVSLSLSDELATTPQYNAHEIEASDASGLLALSHVDDEDDRHYNVERATMGDVVLNFTAKPQVHPGKLEFLHMGAENNGKALFGHGLAFIAAPTGKNYTINLNWDLTKAPDGTRAVWSFGGMSVTTTGPPSLVSESFFAVGQMNSLPPLGAPSNFTTRPGPPDDSYLVFSIRFPANSNSGASAKTRSFMFPVSGGMTIKETEIILAHELVHTWPTASDAANGSSAEWYVEGVVDYYSVNLLYRYRQGCNSLHYIYWA